MARIADVVLFLSLAITPAADAAAPSSGESRAAEWSDTLRSACEWLFSWVPTLRAAPEKSGALIIPDGLTASPPMPESGALIVPDGGRRPGPAKR